MGTILKLSQYLKERNVQIGYVLIIIATFFTYLITFNFFTGIFLFADIQFIIGVCIGEIYALRKRTLDQTPLKCGLIVGLIGGVLSAFMITLFNTFYYLWSFLGFLFFYLYILVTAVPIGLLIGALISSYYMYTEMKGEKVEEDTTIDDDFYKDLIEEN